MKKFINEYVANGFDGNKAMKQVSPNLTDNNALSVKTCRWLSDPNIIDGIMLKLKGLNLTSDKIEGLIKARMVKIICDKSSRDADSINAGNSLARLTKLIDGNNTQNVTIFSDIKSDLAKLRTKDRIPNTHENQKPDITNSKPGNDLEKPDV